MPIDWQPVVAAIAAFIALQGPAVANLLITLANRRKLEQVHQNTNGSLQTLRDEVARLATVNEELRARVDGLAHPPGPV